MHRGDELIERLCAGGISPSERATLAEELWLQFGTGYPIERLGHLLRCGSEEAAKAAAFLIQELGMEATPLLGEIDFMLSHPVRNVRFEALDAVLVCATSEHGPLIAKAIGLVADEERAVRSQTLKFLGRASESQLRASLPALRPPLRSLTEWLLEADTPERRRRVADLLDDEDPSTRKFAAAAARRISDGELMERAAENDDEEVRSYATFELEMLELSREREERRRRRSGRG